MRVIQKLFNKNFVVANACLQFQTRKYFGLPENLKLRYCITCIAFNYCTEENFPVLYRNLYFLKISILEMSIENTKSTLK